MSYLLDLDTPRYTLAVKSIPDGANVARALDWHALETDPASIPVVAVQDPSAVGAEPVFCVRMIDLFALAERWTPEGRIAFLKQEAARPRREGRAV